jgi:hypothetical protein
MSLNEVRLLSGEKGITIGKNENGSPIIITTMAEQLKPMNHRIHIFQTEINA